MGRYPWRVIWLTGCLFLSLFADLWAKDDPDTRVLKYALHTTKLGTLDPHMSKGSQDATYADLLFNALLRFRPGNSRELEPDLAEALPEFEIINACQVWTIRLKQGVYFHASPGFPAHEMTANDVVFSLRKAADPAYSSKAGRYQGMEFEVQDRYALTIKLDTPMSPLFFYPKITNGQGAVILSRQVIETGGYDRFLAHPVGTGPFQFTSYKEGEKLSVAANPRYFRGRPRLDRVEVLFIPDNQEREARFLSGEIHVIYGVGTPGWLEKMENRADARVDVFGPGYTGLLHLNTAMPPLDDIRVRQAISLALDRRGLMAETSGKLVSPVLGPMSPAFLPAGMGPELVRSLNLAVQPDLNQAKTLLAEAGWGQGIDLEIPVSEKRLYQDTYKAVQSQLAKASIRLALRPVSHSQYHKLIRDNRSPLVLYFTFRPDPDSYLRGFFHSDSIVSTGKTPHTNFSNFSGVDKLLDKAVMEIDPKRQIMFWEQAQIKILSQAVVYPLFDINQCVVRHPDVNYGHELISTLTQYPQFDETTSFMQRAP